MPWWLANYKHPRCPDHPHVVSTLEVHFEGHPCRFVGFVGGQLKRLKKMIASLLLKHSVTFPSVTHIKDAFCEFLLGCVNLSNAFFLSSIYWNRVFRKPVPHSEWPLCDFILYLGLQNWKNCFYKICGVGYFRNFTPMPTRPYVLSPNPWRLAQVVRVLVLVVCSLHF